MSNNPFSPAVRKQLKHRIAIAGPTGGGKTLGALRMAYGLCGDWAKVFVIDTESESALAYANDAIWGVGQFMHAKMSGPHTAEKYLDYLNGAANAGAEVIVIDSFSHFWSGAGGILDQHSALKGKNGYVNWGEVNPKFYAVIDWIMFSSPAHIICTLRSKMAYVLNQVEENGRTKQVPEKIGVEPIQRPGTEYEFLLYLDVQRENHLAEIVTQRGSMFPVGTTRIELNEATGQRLKEWAVSGVEPSQQEVWKAQIGRLKASSKDVEAALGVARVSEWIAGDAGRTMAQAIDTVRGYMSNKNGATVHAE